MDINVNWDLFTPEEQEKFKALMTLNQPSSLVTVVNEMTREKEIEVQKIVDSMTPDVPDAPSTVVDEYWKAHPNGPQSPQDEAELQALIDEEAKQVQLKKIEDSRKRLGDLSLTKEVSGPASVVEEVKEVPVVEPAPVTDEVPVEHPKRHYTKKPKK